MIVCPACQAENPDGTKICVKCATELPKADPKAAAKAAASPEASQGSGPKDLRRDFVDVLWLLMILLLIFVLFFGQATQWTFRFTVEEAATVVETPKKSLASKPKPRSDGAAVPVGEEPAAVYGDPETLYVQGKGQYDTKKYHSSYQSLRQALEIDPTFAKAYYGMGRLYAMFQMNDAAVRMYEMTLRFDPAHVDALNNLGMRYYEAGNYDDALMVFQQVVQKDSQNGDYEYNLGSVYLEKGQFQQALSSFQKASALKPSDPSIQTHLALTYEKLGRRQEALDTWQKVIQFAESPEMYQQAQTHLYYLQNPG